MLATTVAVDLWKSGGDLICSAPIESLTRLPLEMTYTGFVSTYT